MKKLILVFYVIGTIMVFFGCQEESALTPELSQNEQIPASLAKPLPNLTGTTYTPFTSTPPTFWNGIIDFGEDFGENHIFGITFFSFEPPREYSQASPFYEEFIIYKLGTTDWENPENIYMKGWNAGVVTHANNPPDDPSKFLANGKITEAYWQFEMWQGRNWHIRGNVTWIDVGLPEKAEGTFRIN